MESTHGPSNRGVTLYVGGFLESISSMPTHCIYCRLKNRDYERLKEIVEARDEDVATFVRRAIKFEFKRLGYASEREVKALGEPTT